MVPEAGTTRTEENQAERRPDAPVTETAKPAVTETGKAPAPENAAAGRAPEVRTAKPREAPRQSTAEPLKVGAVMEGKVTSITRFGAFVSLDNRRSGLVHISEIANTYVNDVHDYLQEGQTVKVVVLSSENGKVNLSIKKAAAAEAGKPVTRPQGRPGGGSAAASTPRPSGRYGRGGQQTLPPSGDQAFEDKLKKFLSSSEGKMADLNRNREGKRGGGRRRK